jgi:hypothetical protein
MSMPTMASTQDFPLSKDYSGNYLCRMTASAGITFNEASQKWVSAIFDVENSSYIVQLIGTGDTEKDEIFNQTARIYNITVKDFNYNGKAFPCLNGTQTRWKERQRIAIASGYSSCSFLGWKYQFNFETMKMQKMYDGAYMDTELHTDTPSVSVGKCQRFD